MFRPNTDRQLVFLSYRTKDLVDQLRFLHQEHFDRNDSKLMDWKKLAYAEKLLQLERIAKKRAS